jgi:DNA-binding NarL/FixJ family response regulator
VVCPLELALEGVEMKALIVDDHPLIQAAVSNVLRALDAAVEIAVAGDCDSAFEIAGEGQEPDLVLLDLNLPGLSGLPALKRWRSRFPAVPIVVLSATHDQQTVVAAMTAGAAGYIPKSSSNEVMHHALSLVVSGGKYLPPEVLAAPGGDASHVVHRKAVNPATSLDLTERQLAVLRSIAKGASNKVICRELGLAERTVKAHVTAVLRALQVASRTQAAVEAVRLGLTDVK